MRGMCAPTAWTRWTELPWTRRQVKKLLSSGSPLSEDQQRKMKEELHRNPKLGHAKKGSEALKKK
jgi:hypothetical protein